MSSTQEAGNIFGAGPGLAHAMMRSPTVLIASVGLWGMNIYFFNVFNIDYVRVLKYDLLRIDNNMSDDSIHRALKKDTSDHDGSSSIGGGTGGPGDYNSNNVSNKSLNDDFSDGDEDDEMENLNANNNNNNNVSFLPVMSERPVAAITWYRLVSLSLLLLFILHTTYYVWIELWGGGPVGAVFSFYTVVTVAIMCPLPALLWLRRATVIVLQRSFELLNPRCHGLLNSDVPPRPIPFVDVFFADALCSLSKVFFDWGILLHMAANPGTLLLSPQMRTILLPSALAAVPYIIRARQCVLMFYIGHLRADPKRFQHLWNALKYSTSIFPLCLSAYSKTLGSAAREKELEQYLVLLLVINALYALYWDIVMDWGMMQEPSTAASAMLCSCCNSSNSPTTSSGATGGTSLSLSSSELRPTPAPSCGRVCLRSRLRFGVFMSALILVADAILRFSWVLRFYAKELFPTEDSFVLCTQFLEIFRRALWNLLRVEWENLKQMKPYLTEIGDNEYQEQDTSLPPMKLKMHNTSNHSSNNSDDGNNKKDVFFVTSSSNPSVKKRTVMEEEKTSSKGGTSSTTGVVNRREN